MDLIDELAARGLTLAIAEGDTGGLLLERLTATPGSSAAILGGVVAYHDQLKLSMLGVPRELLREYGAVSAETARAMAEGVRRISGADIGLATTGIAGPGGATPTKPVGLAYAAVVGASGTIVREYRWQGERAQNRASSADAAVALIKELLENNDNPRTPVLHSR